MASMRILSGVQPTGHLHLGNYLGALRQWTAQQRRAECYFCVVDLHAITVPQEPATLRQHIRETAASYIAAGIDPARSAIFQQSRVPEHAELMWLLATLTPLGWLSRMTQFKDKAGKDRENANLGLYAYPVLMAADILLYKPTHVPVGDDQKQHLELTRDVAGAFNRHFNVEYFTLPEPMILGAAARVMSLRDGTKKMSKSDASDYSRIHLTDDADTIRQKIRKAKTDPLPLPAGAAELKDRPEAENLLGIFAALSDQTAEQTIAQFSGQPFSRFKETLTERLIEKIVPMGDTIRRLMQEPATLDAHLERGHEQARMIAARHMAEIRDLFGF